MEESQALARKKTILKEDILKTAYTILREEGFKGFTARNIAKQMNCSTQPIYLEFKNMDHLKNELLEKIYMHLDEEVYQHPRTKDQVIDFCLNYIYFAHQEPIFFKALFLENQIDSYMLHQISLQHLEGILSHDERTKHLNQEDRVYIYENIWPSVYGTAAMVAQGIVSYNEANFVQMIERLLPDLDKFSKWNTLNQAVHY